MNPYEIDLRKKYSGNINFDKNILFIHVPKCCGNFIKKSIGGFKGDSHAKCSDFPDTLYEKMFSFSFVRNPWSRVLSAYNYLLKGGNGSDYDLKSKENFLSQYKSFEEFVLNGLYLSSLSQAHFLPQSYFLDKSLNYIGKCENLKYESKMLPRIFGESFDSNSVKQISNDSYRQFYTDKMSEIVSEIYKKDLLKLIYSY